MPLTQLQQGLNGQPGGQERAEALGSSTLDFQTTLYQVPATCLIVVQLLSHVPLFATPGTAAPPGFPVLHYLLEFAQTHIH